MFTTFTLVVILTFAGRAQLSTVDKFYSISDCQAAGKAIKEAAWNSGSSAQAVCLAQSGPWTNHDDGSSHHH